MVYDAEWESYNELTRNTVEHSRVHISGGRH